MQYVFAILIIALLVKDTAPLGDIYILRGLSEGLALVVGSMWLLIKGSSDIYKRYLVIFVYLGILFLTAIESKQPFFVIFQTFSLVAVIVFFIAFAEEQTVGSNFHEKAFRTAAIVLTVVCAGSLVLLALAPRLAYDLTGETLTSDSYRFKGLFGKPAMMGAAAGVLAGLSLFGTWNVVLRLIGILTSLPCLYLTGSRTFWAAALLGAVATAPFYVKHRWVLGLAVVFVLISAPLFIESTDLKVSSETRARVIRAESLENFSGRTSLWELALDRFWDRPFLGYGFTVGHEAFTAGSKAKGISQERLEYFQNKSFSLHNGFIQALLDSGIVGTLFYVSIMGLALWKVFSSDDRASSVLVMYSLVFLTISNFGETVVFTAAVFQAVFYWYVAVLAFSLRTHQVGISYRTHSCSLSELIFTGR